MEVSMIIVALVPTEVHLYGVKFPSDGKKIFFIFTQNYQRLFFTHHRQEVTRIAGDRAEPRVLFKNDIRTLELFLKAEIELAYRHFDKAIALINKLLNAENASEAERVYLLDLLASVVIILGQKQYLTQADRWSQEAIKLAGYSKTIQGTRGAILVELGKYEEGKQMLLPLTKPGSNPIDIAISGCYLAKADHRLGKREQARTWLKQAEQSSKKVPALSEMFASIKQELHESLN